MARTVVVKLLGRKISYLTMFNKLQTIWKTKQPLQIIDSESDYFSVNFQNDDDCLLMMSGGPWTIFGQYLSVRLWTPEFSTNQEFPKNLMIWIKLPGLLEGMCTRSLLKFIGGAIGPVVKIDRNTTSKSRGQFARIAVYIDLGKLLISKLQIDGRIQRVEYESV
ncbi:hypothetical protein J1N35_043311 [Gossypium stocksii]|uniref:DUF4283 domain-containing protein n=1 Tax=Gossypium stocksii TaxID=47602 RepID=A0A9D3U765_9ROSI|nr:hypothetical protein J1N35_043311 [Gossypium stocksii]